MATNFGSIVGGIVRGLSNDKRSAGLTGSNVKTDNPLTYAWIGQNTSDLRQPIQKEMSQNPSLPFDKASTGTQYEYTQPLPTDIRTLVSAGSPGTNIGITDQASSIGSLVQTVPQFVPMNNWQFNNYGMSPQNADHFKSYFANQMGVRNSIPIATPANVLTAISEQQNTGSDGPTDPWENTMGVLHSFGKHYRPTQQFLGR